MVFNSIFFIFCFLPVFMLIYYLVPGKLRNLLLFLGSLIFYAWGEPVYVILMLFSSIFNYYMGTELERLYYDDRKQKINLIFSIIINLAVLVFFKYYGFLLNTIGGIIGIHIPHPELSLPIGLSFYTFRNLSYLFKQGQCAAKFPDLCRIQHNVSLYLCRTNRTIYGYRDAAEAAHHQYLQIRYRCRAFCQRSCKESSSGR